MALGDRLEDAWEAVATGVGDVEEAEAVAAGGVLEVIEDVDDGVLCANTFCSANLSVCILPAFALPSNMHSTSSLLPPAMTTKPSGSSDTAKFIRVGFWLPTFELYSGQSLNVNDFVCLLVVPLEDTSSTDLDVIATEFATGSLSH